MKIKNPVVAIVMGSDSDLPVVKEATQVFEQFCVPYEINVLSAHRTPDEASAYAKNAEKNGIRVIIAAAGGAAHLPGVIAAYTNLPVIGIPIKSKSLQGLDSLLSIVQMPSGIPVATMAIDGAKNAGLYACKILALSDKKIKEKLSDHRIKMRNEVLEKNKKLQKGNMQ